MNTDFKIFTNNNPDWKNDFHIYQRDDETFQRMKCIWNEKETGLSHEYHACINVETGEIYQDDQRKTIFLKHVGLALTRPIHTLVKTAWHLSIIGPLALEIINTVNGKQTTQDLIDHTINSLADIIRTPLYGLAMTINHLAGILLGVLATNTLYKTREIGGWLERQMLRNEKPWESSWVWSKCFSPIRNLSTIHQWKVSEPTEQSKDSTLEGMSHFAKSFICTLRKINKMNCCSNPFSANGRFVSLAAKNGV